MPVGRISQKYKELVATHFVTVTIRDQIFQNAKSLLSVCFAALGEVSEFLKRYKLEI